MTESVGESAPPAALATRYPAICTPLRAAGYRRGLRLTDGRGTRGFLTASGQALASRGCHERDHGRRHSDFDQGRPDPAKTEDVAAEKPADDATDQASEEDDRGEVRLSFGGVVHDPTDPVGRLLFNVLAMVAEFEADLIRLRTREGMKVAKAKGRLRGKQPKLNARQEAHLVALHEAGEHSTAELANLFGVARSTVYRAIERDARHHEPKAARPGDFLKDPVLVQGGVVRRAHHRPVGGPRPALSAIGR